MFLTTEALYLQRISTDDLEWAFDELGTATELDNVPLSDSNDLIDSWKPGARVAIGGRINDKVSVEAGGFWIQEYSGSRTLTDANTRFGTPTDGDLNLFNDNTGEFDGANFALGKYNSRIWGAEALGRYDYRPNVQWLGGFRYISLDEDMAINYVDGVDGIDFGQYRIESYNSMVGVQGGFDGRMPVGDSVDFNLTGLLGVFANRIEASQVIADNIGEPGSTTLDRYQNDEGFATTFMGELRAGLEAALGSNIILGIGYQALFLTNVALAPDQADITETELPARGVDNRGAVLYHGGRAYAVWRFGGRD